MRKMILAVLLLMPVGAQAAFQSYTVTGVTKVTVGGAVTAMRVHVVIRDTVLSTPAVPAVLNADGTVKTPAVPAAPVKDLTYTLTRAQVATIKAATVGAPRLSALDGVINAVGASWITRDYTHWVHVEMAPAPAVKSASLTTEFGSPAPTVTVAN